MWKNIKLATMETPELSSRSISNSERSLDESKGRQKHHSRQSKGWISFIKEEENDFESEELTEDTCKTEDTSVKTQFSEVQKPTFLKTPINIAKSNVELLPSKMRIQQEIIKGLELGYNAEVQQNSEQKSISISFENDSLSFSEENIDIWTNENEVLLYLLYEMKLLDSSTVGFLPCSFEQAKQYLEQNKERLYNNFMFEIKRYQFNRSLLLRIHNCDLKHLLEHFLNISISEEKGGENTNQSNEEETYIRPSAGKPILSCYRWRQIPMI